jgi:ABC-type Mn2+/Zn2+ transport system ATPase subunit
MRAGIALIPKDRCEHAIVPMVSVEQNFGLANQKHFACFGVLRGGARGAEARKYASDLQIRPPNILTPMANLSGGNRQKFVIARWLATGARVLMFDEHIRGVGVGAKAEIYALLRQLAAAGAAVLVISSELPELLLPSHRIGVVNRGRLTQILENRSHLNEGVLMRHATAGCHDPKRRQDTEPYDSCLNDPFAEPRPLPASERPDRLCQSLCDLLRAHRQLLPAVQPDRHHAAIVDQCRDRRRDDVGDHHPRH